MITVSHQDQNEIGWSVNSEIQHWHNQLKGGTERKHFHDVFV